MRKLIETTLQEQYKKYYRLAYSYAGNEADALDIVQEGAYKAIRQWRKLKQPEFVDTWIYKIMMYTALDMTRKRKRMAECEYGEEEPMYIGGITKERPSHEDEVIARNDMQQLLDTLEDDERAVVVLRYYEDMQWEEVAQITGCNVNTVKSRLYRALKKLKSRAGEEEERRQA